MPEELQRYQVKKDGRVTYQGNQLGPYEHYILGNTTLLQLKKAGIIEDFVTEIRYQPRLWPGKPSKSSRPDEIILDGKNVIAVIERKSSSELDTPVKEEVAAEQCLVYLQQLRGKIGIVTDYAKFIWLHNLDPTANELRYIYDDDELFQSDYREDGVLEHVLQLLDPATNSLVHEVPVDPSSLADSVWQTIWHATHEEPKLCLATFVELFLYKFLSDLELLPETLRIEELNVQEHTFKRKHGVTQIEYYVKHVRPKMKSLFPEGMNVSPPLSGFLEGSKATSIVDNFVFGHTNAANIERSLDSFNHEFLDIIKTFVEFRRVTNIDSEFKSRVYEKFLKKNVKQQKLGQYLTPRNVVRAIIGMAQPQRLFQHPGAIICDPACGVGGFLLEPLLHKQYLEGNLVVDKDKVNWKISLIGLEVDRQTNILSKANMLIHLAERYVTLNEKQKQSFASLMNNTFILCDHDLMLGALEFPQDSKFDLIMTNPPFVVKGSRVIKNPFQNCRRQMRMNATRTNARKMEG